MTDNEIIKGLECCGVEQCCKGCPYNGMHLPPKMYCQDQKDSNALDLITRQKTEIERLQGELIIERTRRENAVKAYHEARKEFAERFKERDGENNHTVDDCASILVPEEYKKGRYEKTEEVWRTIDVLLTEMESESE